MATACVVGLIVLLIGLSVGLIVAAVAGDMFHVYAFAAGVNAIVLVGLCWLWVLDSIADCRRASTTSALPPPPV